MSAAAPLLAALLRAALPGLRALDFGLPSPPVLHPWLPGALCGAADAAALPPAEAALLRRFRHPDGRRLFGFDPAADGALLAGAPAAWDDAPECLIRWPAALPCDAFADALLLVPPDAACPVGPARARILLLLGAGEAVERYDLLVPPPRLEALHAALRDAAASLAGAAGGPPWLARSLAVSADMASVALLPEEPRSFRPPVTVPAAALLHDLPAGAGPHGLDLSGTGRVRVLLGTAPARLRVLMRGDAAGVALFQDGVRLPAVLSDCAATGEACLEAEPRSVSAGAAAAAVFGLAVPEPVRVAITRLELLP